MTAAEERPPGPRQKHARADRLETELRLTRERLRTAQEELATAQEELRSSAEEIQVVSGELQERVRDQARTNTGLRNLLAAAQIATVLLDASLRVVGFTPAVSALFPLIEADLGRPLADIACRIAYPDMVADAARVLQTLTAVEREIGPPQGPRYHVRALPYRNLDDAVAGAVLTFMDVTQATAVQAELQRGEERTRIAASVGRMFTWEMDLATRHVVRAPPPRDVLGFDVPADIDEFATIVHANDRDSWHAAIQRSVQQGRPLDVEYRLQPPGQPLMWMRTRARSNTGRLVGVTQDISERKQADEWRATMFAELQHRVKNTLAVVRSISTRTLEKAGSLESYSTHFGGRLDALARTQAVLARRGTVGIELQDMVRDELAATAARDDEQAEVSGPRVMLRDKAAEAFAMVLHELATNAVKYGALATPEGKVAIEWRVAESTTLVFLWQERGVTALNPRPARIGFGRDLIERGLPYDLGAVTELTFAPGGVQCRLALPLGPRIVAGEDAVPP